MKNRRRQFLKQTALASLGIASHQWLNASGLDIIDFTSSNTNMTDKDFEVQPPSVIGLYGPWAASLNEKKLPSLSFRRKEFSNIEDWRNAARKQVMARMSIPNIGGVPKVVVNKQYTYDGLHIEELSWQLPYGRATEAILLKPENAKGKLPGILAFHDHSGNKYFGTKKITRTSEQQHPSMVALQKEIYEGMAWANEIAKRGYVVLVNDAFPFASRRVMMQDVPEELRHGLNDNDPEDPANIEKYNQWAGQHEHIMAKSLFCAGTTWPALFFIEDQKALDILCARSEVDAERVGCGGLSGGGMRTVFMGGLDPRIKCAITVGFMTTWKDFLLYKTVNHTWMIYVPLLPNELDFPEILGLRAPLPSMVLCDEQDELYTMEGMNDAEKILKEVYAKAGAENNFKCSYYPGPHKFDKKMQADAFDWFDRWLKK